VELEVAVLGDPRLPGGEPSHVQLDVARCAEGSLNLGRVVHQQWWWFLRPGPLSRVESAAPLERCACAPRP